MTTKTTYDICVLPGDGIGVDVVDATLPLLDKLTHDAGFSLHFATHPAGAQHYAATGEALPAKTLEAARAADAIFFGAMGWPAIRYPDGTEIAPQLDLRVELELFAGVRPARALPGLPMPLADPRARQIDLVVVRESTEGLFASRGLGTIENDNVARDTMVITRKGCERLHDFAFRLAQRRKAKGSPGRVTCVDKANVFRSMAFFRKIFDERARAFPDIEARHNYIDATALDLIRKPWEFDVLVTENMFGDILSDETAALVGGMGMAPSGDIGDRHGMFQPCHGSAPDIAGQGKANPIATILSGALMLDWLAQQHGNDALARAAERLERAVDTALESGKVVPIEFGGRDGTTAIAADRNIAVGFATPRPAISGAVPWHGWKTAWRSPTSADGAIPMPPMSAAPRSDRMSPNMFSVTSTSKSHGERTRRSAVASTYAQSASTSG